MAADYVGEDWWQRLVFELRQGNLDVKLSSSFVLKV